MKSHAFFTKRAYKYTIGHSYHKPNSVCAMSYYKEKILSASHSL